MSIIFNSADIAETMNNGVSNVTGADSTITEDYTNVVQHGIKIDMSVSEKTISGTPPLTFNSKGTPLLDYTIYGNSIQNGTPIQLQECGERTGNMCNPIPYKNNHYINENGVETQSNGFDIYKVAATAQTKYTLSLNTSLSGSTVRIHSYSNGSWTEQIAAPTVRTLPITFTTPQDCDEIRFSITNEALNHIMLNTGNTALPYEPYGYKIPISVSGRIYNVYIGNSPLRKAIDGSNAVDTINYGTQQLIRRVDSNGTALSEPVTETIEVPQIATIDGINVIDVQTTPKPSNISITYKGR